MMKIMRVRVAHFDSKRIFHKAAGDDLFCFLRRENYEIEERARGREGRDREISKDGRGLWSFKAR